MENTEKQVIDIEQLANDLNDKAISKNQVLEKYDIKDSKMKRLLKANGYMYNGGHMGLSGPNGTDYPANIRCVRDIDQSEYSRFGF